MSAKSEAVMLTFCAGDSTVLWAELLEGGNLRGALEAACNRLDADPALCGEAAYCGIDEPDEGLMENFEDSGEINR